MSAAAPAEEAVEPPAFLRLTGHAVRWQILNELARSDRQVRELVSRVGQRQSLISYHLGQLREGGLVTARRSSADRRDSYYRLDLTVCRDLLVEAGAALHPGLRLVPATHAPVAGVPARRSRQSTVKVLFLCTGNGARSQMAEAILNELGGPTVKATSAGSHPKALHPLAVRVMRERGIDISRQRPKNVTALGNQQFDYVISLCDRVREVCPDFSGRSEVAHWSMPDPSSVSETDEDGYLAFVRTADELTTRIQFLLHTIGRSATTAKGSEHG